MSDTYEMDADDSAAEARLARKALGLPDLDAARAKGRQVVDGWVRGTALLGPGEEADTWVACNFEKVTASFHARKNRPAEQVAFFEGMREAADEAIADLQAYKNRLYGR
jgi:hypothetical protein